MLVDASATIPRSTFSTTRSLHAREEEGEAQRQVESERTKTNAQVTKDVFNMTTFTATNCNTFISNWSSSSLNTSSPSEMNLHRSAKHQNKINELQNRRNATFATAPGWP